jgi:uncharacterized membrane protein (UPF0182 family)
MRNRKWFIGLALILIALGFLNTAVILWVDWLWFQDLGYPVLFTKSLLTQVSLFAVSGVVFFVVVYSNAQLARRLAPQHSQFDYEHVIEFPQLEGLRRFIRWILLGGTLFLSYVVAGWAGDYWMDYLKFTHSLPFNVQDPLFQRDVGFYMFSFPFYRLLCQFGFVTLFFVLLICLLVYLLEGGVWLTRRGPRLAPAARTHLSAVAALFLVLMSVKYRLDIFDLLFSKRGFVYGASYADIKAVLPALWALVAASLVSALLVFLSAFRRSYRLALGGVVLLILTSVVGTGVYPEILQRLEVAPNEISVEKPYIELGIKFTRMAYGLDSVQEERFPVLQDLDRQALKRNDLTLQNIRLWDHRPLLQTYRQLQVIRPYYDFVDVDNDRYVIDGKYRQVSLAPREIASSKLPSRIWINEHLTYTHGYGLCLGPVNEISREGLPQLMIKDIPPVASTNIMVSRPQIYYGEITDSYCFVNTRSKEFDYPSGDENVYTEYQGSGGIPVKNFFRTLLFSFRFKEPKIILSSDITGDSRLMFDRTISERIRKLVPFLRYDHDPYMVISENGQIYWMMDGYTTGENFPYSLPTEGVGNYIRNSVKTTIDAYNGIVRFYVSDPRDPIIQVYARIFPGVFQPLEAMPKDLRKHMRYPEDLFTLQAGIYATYHMTDPQVFYNKEDLWHIPALSKYNGESVVEPYYTIMKLNTKDAREEFILMTPFTPASRENMIAWMAARCDEPNYGKLIVYNFPKQRLVYGPLQIGSRINQDTQISQQLTLWNQKGSRVENGTLLVIPIEDSILYIQPLYLAAEQAGNIPELKRIIVAYGNTIAMEENLELSLARIFGGGPLVPKESAVQPTPPSGREEASLKTLVEQAGESFRRAQQRLRNGDWAGYGEELRKLEETLQTLKGKTK